MPYDAAFSGAELCFAVYSLSILLVKHPINFYVIIYCCLLNCFQLFYSESSWLFSNFYFSMDQISSLRACTKFKSRGSSLFQSDCIELNWMSLLVKISSLLLSQKLGFNHFQAKNLYFHESCRVLVD